MPKIVQISGTTYTLVEAMEVDINKLDDVEMMKVWRKVKDEVTRFKGLMEPFDTRRKVLEKRVMGLLKIDDEELKSNKVSVPNAGWAYKEEKIGATVKDWEGFQDWLHGQKWLSIMRAQMKEAGLQELYETIMKGDLEAPPKDLVEFVPYEKLTIRVHNTKKKEQ